MVGCEIGLSPHQGPKSHHVAVYLPSLALTQTHLCAKRPTFLTDLSAKLPRFGRPCRVKCGRRPMAQEGAVRGGQSTLVGSFAGISCQVRPHSRLDAWVYFARLATTLFLLLAFFAPPPITVSAGRSAHHIQKTGRQQIRIDRPSASTRTLLSLTSNPSRRSEAGITTTAGSRHIIFSPPELLPTTPMSPASGIRVFRPLRC